MRGDEGRGNPPEVETLAAAQDGGQDLLRLGGGEDELDVLGRFFERLEQRVERRRGQHVDLVDDVDLILPVRGGVPHVVSQFADLLDAVVARAVDLQHVEAGAGGNLPARVADAAGFDRRGLDAAEGLGKDARGGRFAGAARPDEQVGVGEAVLRDGVLERAGDVLLPHHVVKRLRTVLARENLITHGQECTAF